MLDPSADLPDETPIKAVRLPHSNFQCKFKRRFAHTWLNSGVRTTQHWTWLRAMAEGTAMKTDLARLGLVPVGEENAVTARLLWQVNRVGVVATVKCKLNTMASQGIVRRKKI